MNEENKGMRITRHVDSGHSWYGVPRDMIDTLGVADKISTCSYVDDRNVYAEEDCDAGIVLRALDEQGVAYYVAEARVNGDSWIRNLGYYNPQQG